MELAIIITLLGMGTVFIVLYVISLIIRGMGVLFHEKKLPALPAAPVPPSLPAAAPAPSGEDSDELVAVITAALSLCMGSSTGNSLVVRPMAHPANAWANAARSENTQK